MITCIFKSLQIKCSANVQYITIISITIYE